MITRKLFALLLFTFLLVYKLDAQNPSKWELNGYLSNMQSQLFEEADARWFSDNLIHNRINIFWYPGSNITASVQLRNRFIYGTMKQFFPDYEKLVKQDNGWFDLSHNISAEQSYILNSTADRAYIKYTKGSFELTAGRQRINWGQNFVWNPNDLFNAYSFFEVDYPERPGSDAIRMQYYTGFTSSVEVAAKVNNQDEITASALLRFNKWGYDFQLLGGIYNQNSAVLGAGWAGSINNAGFHGEVSYFHPRHNWQNSDGTLVASAGLDYMLDNSLYLQTEAIYNKMPDNYNISSFMGTFTREFSAKQLLFTEYALFLQASYPITPLWNATISTMFFPKLEGYYLSPGIDYSVSNNIGMSLIFQRFSGQFSGNYTSSQNLVYFRLKWNY